MLDWEVRMMQEHYGKGLRCWEFWNGRVFKGIPTIDSRIVVGDKEFVVHPDATKDYRVFSAKVQTTGLVAASVDTHTALVLVRCQVDWSMFESKPEGASMVAYQEDRERGVYSALLFLPHGAEIMLRAGSRRTWKIKANRGRLGITNEAKLKPQLTPLQLSPRRPVRLW
jgi:hypothetical protein